MSVSQFVNELRKKGYFCWEINDWLMLDNNKSHIDFQLGSLIDNHSFKLAIYVKKNTYYEEKLQLAYSILLEKVGSYKEKIVEGVRCIFVEEII